MTKLYIINSLVTFVLKIYLDTCHCTYAHIHRYVTHLAGSVH